MPTIQIIGQEKLAARMGERDRELERQKMQQQAYEKSIAFKQMDQQLKLQAKGVENEVEKLKIDRLGHRMAYLSNVYKTAMDSPNPELVVKTALQLGGADMMQDLSNPMVADMISKLQPSGDTALKQGAADLIKKQMGATPSGMPNQPATNAMNGGLQVSGLNIGGIQMDDYGVQAAGQGQIKSAQLKQEMEAAAAPALAIVDDLEKSWNKAFPNAPEKGSRMIQGAGDVIGGSWLRGNSDIRSYLTTKAALLTKLSRGLGEKGMITDKDVARVNQALADAFTNKETARKNFAVIRSIISGGIQRYGGGQSTQPTSPQANLSRDNDPLGIFK
jgi:hypothetical protein